MPKKEKKTEAVEKRGEKSLDAFHWLKESRKSPDLQILRKLIINSDEWKSETSTLDETLFEKSFNLPPLPILTVSDAVLDRALSFERVMDEITTRLRPLRPKGKNLREQIYSLLPKGLEKEEIRSLTYALSRIVLEKIPRESRWPVVPPGLDTLSAAIITIYLISEAVEQKVSWLYTLWSYKIEQAKIDELDKILGLLRKDVQKDQIIKNLDDITETINKSLGQDPQVDISIAQPDTLTIRISDWIRRLKTKDMKKKELIIEISKELAILKGFSGPLEKEIDVRSASATNFNILALRADGPLAISHEPFLQLLRKEINILRYSPFVKLCMYLSKEELPGRPTAKDIEHTTDYSGRNAYYTLQKLEMLLNEQYLPNFRRIGLRYRYIFTPRQRPGVLSEGLVERLVLTEQNIRGCAANLEPIWTEGPDPRKFPEGSLEAVVEEELVSLNINHFDTEKGEWSSTIWDGYPSEIKQSRRLILRSTASELQESYRITERELELLSVIWSSEGTKTHRRWLLNSINYPARTANKILREWTDNKIVKLIYLPALEYCGLPDGLMAVANCHDRRSRDSLIDMLTQQLPYVRVFFGDSNDIVAYVRVPVKTSDKVGGVLREMMRETSDNPYVARIKESKIYRMTTLYRLRNFKTKEWIDPWPVSRYS